LKLLLDEMYSPALAEALRAVDIETSTVVEIGMAGSSDPEVFATAVAGGYTLLTENVADFARISAEHLTTGERHPGVLIALSSRFSRRPAGRGALVEAIGAIVDQTLGDRIVYL
jgi:predicted nuclease of predicted toxin-antitoxin system